MDKLPVLIGSFAVKPEGIITCCNVKEFKDIDIICDVSIKNKLPDKYKCIRIDEELILSDNKTSLSLIFDYCNNNKKSLRIEKILETIDIIVCPLTLLYALKKSHIHRIIPYFEDDRLNIKIWHKNANQYLYLRENCGIDYKLLDEIIYQRSVDKIYTEHDDIIRDIFYTSFNEISKKIGDTKISLDEDKESFFQDNIERFYDHDKLHVLVAKENRNQIEPIYLKYQTNANVNLDKEKFMQDTMKNHIDMFREEIMVLLLERKILPTIINCYAKPMILYSGYEKKRFKNDIKEMIAIYATNLCGNGHSWLRNYVIDHLKYLYGYDLSILEKIAQFVLKELNINLSLDEIKIQKLKFKPNVKNMHSVLVLCSKHNTRNPTKLRIDENKIYHQNKNVEFYLPISNIINVNIKKIIRELVDSFNEKYKFTIVFAVNNYFYVYNTAIGCGICYNNNNHLWIQFVMSCEFGNQISVDSQYILFNNNPKLNHSKNIIQSSCSGSYECESIRMIDVENDQEYDRHDLCCSHGVYYYSRGQYCGETGGTISDDCDSDEFCYDSYDNEVDLYASNKKSYSDSDAKPVLSHYGTLPEFIHKLMIHITNFYFGIGNKNTQDEFKELINRNQRW